MSARLRPMPLGPDLGSRVPGGALADAIRSHLLATCEIGSRQTEVQLQEAAALLSGAETVHVVASGRSYPVGLLASFALRDHGIRAQLATRVDAEVTEALSLARARDAILELGTPAPIERRSGRSWLPCVAIVSSTRAQAFARADRAIMVRTGPFAANNALIVVHALAGVLKEPA